MLTNKNLAYSLILGIIFILSCSSKLYIFKQSSNNNGELNVISRVIDDSTITISISNLLKKNIYLSLINDDFTFSEVVKPSGSKSLLVSNNDYGINTGGISAFMPINILKSEENKELEIETKSLETYSSIQVVINYSKFDIGQIAKKEPNQKALMVDKSIMFDKFETIDLICSKQ